MSIRARLVGLLPAWLPPVVDLNMWQNSVWCVEYCGRIACGAVQRNVVVQRGMGQWGLCDVVVWCEMGTSYTSPVSLCGMHDLPHILFLLVFIFVYPYPYSIHSMCGSFCLIPKYSIYIRYGIWVAEPRGLAEGGA